MAKNKKKKSIFRFEAIIPSLIILLGLSLYLIFLFDANMKFALEWALTRAHGAEVNIGKFNSNFKSLKVEIKNIQFTYDKDPKLNVVELDEISLNLLWKALLQAKYIIPQANINNIQTMSPRKSPGRVLPQSDRTGYRGASNNIKEQINEQVEGNILSDLYKISKGTDVKEQLKSIQYDLKTDQKIKKLEKDLKEKEKKWKENISKLPKKEDLKIYEDRIKKIDVKSKNALGIAKQIKEASSIYKDIKKDLANFKETSKELKLDVNSYKSEISNIDNLIKEDMNSLKKKFKIPSFDAESISKSVFFPIIQSKLLEFKRYISMAQSYFPQKSAKKDEGKDKIALPKRGKGKNYYFPRKNSYPKFWLKNADISSTVNESEFSGNFKGKITNISNNPKHLGIPIKAFIKGDAPKQEIKGIDALITVDHTGDVPRETLEFSVASFPTKNLILSKASDLTIQVAKSLLSSKITAFHSNDNFKFNLKNQFNQADYIVDGKSDSVKKMVLSTLKNMAALTLNGTIEGTWKKFSLHLNSNFGEELSNALKDKVKNTVKKAETELKSKVFGKVNKSKDQLKSQFKKISNGSLSDLKNKEELLEKLKKEVAKLKDKKPSLDDKSKEKLKEKGKKVLKDLFG